MGWREKGKASAGRGEGRVGGVEQAWAGRNNKHRRALTDEVVVSGLEELGRHADDVTRVEVGDGLAAVRVAREEGAVRRHAVRLYREHDVARAPRVEPARAQIKLRWPHVMPHARPAQKLRVQADSRGALLRTAHAKNLRVRSKSCPLPQYFIPT